MTKLTNAQLVQQLEAAHVSYQRLEAECASLKAQLAVPTQRRAPHFTPSEASVIAHDNYARALIAAREEAVRSGRTVRVTR